MKHLFIINPFAGRVKGRIGEVTGSILAFFKDYPYLNYDIHITRWERDALGLIRRYAAKSDEFIRIHIMGGTGTLFEAVNGVVGLPNAHIAAYPFGKKNTFLKRFTDDISVFSSIRSQVFSKTEPVDLIKCGDFYGIAGFAVGIESAANKITSKKGFNNDFWETVGYIVRKKDINPYTFAELDGENIDGCHTAIKAVNLPGRNNAGIFDVYTMGPMSRFKLLTVLSKYLSGKFDKTYITRRKGRKIAVSSPDGIITINLDGQILYEQEAVCEVLCYAADFVLPGRLE